jgi:hypothetical protein
MDRHRSGQHRGFCQECYCASDHRASRPLPEIDVTSPDTATGIWSMEDSIWWPEGSRRKTLHGLGHYHETYQKIGGRWLIKTLKLTRLRVIES